MLTNHFISIKTSTPRIDLEALLKLVDPRAPRTPALRSRCELLWRCEHHNYSPSIKFLLARPVCLDPSTRGSSSTPMNLLLKLSALRHINLEPTTFTSHNHSDVAFPLLLDRVPETWQDPHASSTPFPSTNRRFPEPALSCRLTLVVGAKLALIEADLAAFRLPQIGTGRERRKASLGR